MTEPDTMTEQIELNQIKRKTILGASAYFIRSLFLQLIGFVSVALLSVFLNPEDFAVYGFVIQIVGILIFFSDIGLAAALIQKKDEPSEDDYRVAFTVQQILSFFIVLIVGLLIWSGFIESHVGRAGVLIILSLAISFPLAALKTIPSIILERQLKFSVLVVPQIFEQIFFHGILIFMAWKGFGIASYAYAILARSVVGVIVMSFLQPWKIGLSLNKSVLKALLGYGYKFQLNDFLARIKDQLFYFALGLWLPLKEFGYIQWAKNWSMYPYNLTVQNVMAITFPTFSRLQHDPKLLARAIEKSLYFICLFIFPIVAGLSIFIGPLITLVPVYAKWQPAILSLVLFSLSIGWSAISTPLTNTLSAIGKINATLKLMLMWTSATWVVTPLAVWRWGFNGVAISAFLISFTSLVPVFIVKKFVPFNFLDQVWRSLVATLVMSVVGYLGKSMWQQDFKLFILGVMACAVTYLVAQLILGYTKLEQEFNSIRKI